MKLIYSAAVLDIPPNTLVMSHPARKMLCNVFMDSDMPGMFVLRWAMVQPNVRSDYSDTTHFFAPTNTFWIYDYKQGMLVTNWRNLLTTDNARDLTIQGWPADMIRRVATDD